MIKIIDKLSFNFLWGCKRDKIKRDVVRSLKLALIKKVIDPNFSHYWKTIFIKQLKFSENIEISIENTLTSNNCKIVQDVLLCYREWKNKVVLSRGVCINHIVWANDKITDIGPGCGVRTSSLEAYFISLIFWLPIKA